MKVVNLLMPRWQEEVSMTWIWNGLRLPQLGRFWRWRRQRRIPMLDLRLLNAHWRRDLGFDQ
jgi:hypothetical protein